MACKGNVLNNLGGGGLALLISAALLCGCEESRFFGSGEVVSQDIIVEPFTGIEINDIFDIEIKNDSVFRVEAEGSASMLDNFSALVADNTLFLDDNNSYKWLPDYRRIRLTISAPDFNMIRCNNPSMIFSTDTVNVSSISLFMNGQVAETDLIIRASHVTFDAFTTNFGYYKFSGVTESVSFRTYGGIRIDASDLCAGNVRVRSHSIGDTKVHALNELRVWIGHYGNVIYTGVPDTIIIERMDSRGRLIQTP